MWREQLSDTLDTLRLIEPSEGSLSLHRLSQHISRIGLIRSWPGNFVRIEITINPRLPQDSELRLYPPGHVSPWEEFTGDVHQLSTGRAGVHVAFNAEWSNIWTKSLAGYQLHSEWQLDGAYQMLDYGGMLHDGDMLCSYSLDGWMLELRTPCKS